MTRQQVYDQVVLGFAGQKALAIGDPRSAERDSEWNLPGNGCYYRQPVTGNKCAIGILVPDELYNDEIEGDNPSTLYNIYVNPDGVSKARIQVGSFISKLIDDSKYSQKENMIFFDALQEVHDGASDGDNLFYRLKAFATQYQLDYQILFDNEDEFSNWEK